jgi:hypothetical protein
MADGRIRLRSNVLVDGEAWHLVPGDALDHYAPYRLKRPFQPTPRQRAEQMYYVPCGVCGRLAHQIELDGCGATGTKHGALSGATGGLRAASRRRRSGGSLRSVICHASARHSSRPAWRRFALAHRPSLTTTALRFDTEVQRQILEKASAGAQLGCAERAGCPPGSAEVRVQHP